MEFLRLIVLLLWATVTVFLSGFILWRKLRRERVDFEDKVIDRVLIATILGVLAGRIAYALLHLSTFGWMIGKWLSLGSLPGIVDPVSLVAGLSIFWFMLGSDWKDRVEIMDYGAIALAFFLFLTAVGDVILQILSYALLNFSQTQINVPFQVGYVIGSGLFALFYLILFIFLSRVEKRYRTFLWYRAKRRSAQTGFVLASFLMGYGLAGATIGWFVTSSVMIGEIGIDPILKLLVGLAGIVLLYVRSGRRLN